MDQQSRVGEGGGYVCFSCAGLALFVELSDCRLVEQQPLLQ